MKFVALSSMLLLACGGIAVESGGAPTSGNSTPRNDASDDAPPEHHPRFVGRWAVAQPWHARFEITFYDFHADGTLVTGSSDPPDCTGALQQHCVTGSVANCVPNDPRACEGALSCVFGEEWHSLGADVLAIVGACSDGTPREIRLAFDHDPALDSDKTEPRNIPVLSVDGDPNWSHDNFEWLFYKCPAGTDATRCW